MVRMPIGRDPGRTIKRKSTGTAYRSNRDGRMSCRSLTNIPTVCSNPDLNRLCRAKKCRKSQTHLSDDTQPFVVFSGQKFFTMKPSPNNENVRVLERNI